MKKALKITGIVVAVLVGLFAALAVTAKLVITPERVRRTVVSVSERKLHRQMTLGEIRIGIFSGIILKDLTLMEKEVNQPFLSTRQAQLRYQFWPLLSRRVVVDEIVLDAPKVRVVRLPDGTFNFSDLIAKKEKPEAPKPPTKEELNLLVSKLAVTDGEVRFEDRTAPSGTPQVYAVSGIEVTAKDISPERIVPFTVKGIVAGATVEIKGQLSDLAAKPTVTATLRLTDGDVRRLVAALPPGPAARAKAFDPTGKLSAEMRLAGLLSTPKELLKEGSARLDKVEVTASGQRLALNGDLKLKGDTLSSQNLDLAMGENRMKIVLAASHLFGKPLVVNSSVKAERFNLDPLLKKPPVPPSAGGAPAGGAARPEPGPLNLPVQATGTAQLDRTAYKGLPVTGLYLRYRLADNVLMVEELRGSVAGGSFSDSARIELARRGFGYTTRLAVRGVQAAPVVAAFSPKSAGAVSGVLSANAELSGSGVETAAIKKNLTGRGDFSVANGKLTSNLVQRMADFLKMPQLREVHFSTFAGTFRIADGKVLVDSAVSGRDVQLTPKGTVGLDDTLDLALTTRIAPSLTGKVARGEVGNLVTDEKGWGVVPLKVAGTVSAPKFRLDVSGMGAQLKGKAKQKIEQTIQEKLLKQKPGEPQRPEQQLLEKGIKGIFGK